MWNYCTKEAWLEFITSLQLMEGEKDQQLRTLYALSNSLEKHYECIKIPKKSGGWRTLSIPDFLLKQVQKNILHHVLEGFSVSSAATAYCPHKSCFDNALPHVGQPMILKLDIKNFFDSISFAMVYESVFLEEYFPPPVRMLLTTLCCYQGALPQGAPTSATCSNLIFKERDEELLAFAKANHLHYTRYCDDLTFSGTFDPQYVISEVKKIIFPFHLNPQKTQLLRPHQQQLVTGIVVNQTPQMKKKDRNQIRQAMYYSKKFGLVSHLQRILQKVSISKEEQETYLLQMLGKVSYGLFLCPTDSELKTYQKQLLTWKNSH